MDVYVRCYLATVFAASLGVLTMAKSLLSSITLRWRFVLLLVVIVAMITASYQLVIRYLAEQSQALEQKLSADMEWVLVFSRDLEAGSVIELNDLQQRKYPPGYISDDWLRPNDAMAVVGNSVENFVSAGEPVLLGHLGRVRRASFSDTLNPGEYAVTATVGIEQVHHGLLAVGNRVSLVALDSNGNALSMLPNIEVLALDNQSEDYAGSGLAVSITLRLQASQALSFAQLKRRGFALWLQHPDADYKVLETQTPPQVFIISQAGS